MSDGKAITLEKFLNQRKEDQKAFTALNVSISSNQEKISSLQSQINGIHANVFQLTGKAKVLGEAYHLFREKDEKFPEKFFTLEYGDAMDSDPHPEPIVSLMTLVSIDLRSYFVPPSSEKPNVSKTEIVFNFKDEKGEWERVSCEISIYKMLFGQPRKTYDTVHLVSSANATGFTLTKFSLNEKFDMDKHRKLFYLDEVDEIIKQLNS